MAGRKETGSPSLGGTVLARQLRSAPGLVVLIFVAVLLTSGFITAAPRVLERVAAEDLHQTLIEAEPEQRNIRAATQARLGAGPGGGSMGTVAVHGESLLQESFPGSVRDVVGETRYLVESPSFRVTSFPDDQQGPFPTTFRFRFQEDIEDRTTLISGSMPRSAEPIRMLVGDDCPPDRLSVESFRAEDGTNCAVEEITVLETAVTRQTATALGVDSGESFLVRPEGQERLWYMHGLPDETQTWVVTVSGIIELSDPADEFWYADTALHRPRIVENPDFRLIFAQGLVPADLYEELLAAVPTAGFNYTWRFFVDPGKVDAGRGEELIADVAEIAPAIDEDLNTSLPELITGHLEQRTVTITLISVAAATLLVVTVGVILVLADVYAARRARDADLSRDRGASFGQLALTSAYTGLLLVAPATLLAYLATSLALDGTGSLQSGRGALLFAIGGVAAVVVAMTPRARGRGLEPGRSDWGEGGAATRRVVLEVSVVTAAVSSVGLLRRRGLADSTQETFDLLLSVTPAIVGLAVGLLTVRMLVPLTRLIAWFGRRNQSLVEFVGLRRLTSLPTRSRTSLVVIVAAVGLAVLSATVRGSIADGQAAHTWQVVGADVRVEGENPGSPPAVDAGELGQLGRAAEAARFPDTLVIGRGGSPRLSVLAIDVPAYREVLAGSPVSDDVLEALELLEEQPAAGPAPVVVSEEWGTDHLVLGSTMSLDLGAVDPDLAVVAMVDRFPSLDPERPFAVMNLETLRSIRGRLDLAPTAVYLSAPESMVADIAGSVGAMDSHARVLSRYDVSRIVGGDPFVAWADRGLAAVFYLATGFAVLVGVAFFVATSWHRRTDLGLLRIMGLTTRESTAITILEQAVPVTLAALLGVATGAIVPILLAPKFDIEPFTGGTVPGLLAVDWMSMVLVAAVITLVMTVALSIFAITTRSADPISSLSLGDE